MRSKRFLHAEQAPLDWDAPGLLAGVDEAGRGPLAGPVVAAAVMLDHRRLPAGLRDSKTLSAAQRERLHDLIQAQALCVSVAQASVAEIDALNILQATLLAMRRAVEGLRLPPRWVVVDGNRVPEARVPVLPLVGGDARLPAISAASIVAKVVRDRLCVELDRQWPQYGFARHKGYPTQAHLAALKAHGPCEAHRLSFAPVKSVLERP